MWQAVAASVRGTGHHRDGLPCQDAHDFRDCGDRTLVAAVADGLGTADKSDVGSRLAVDSALDALAADLLVSIPDDTDSWESLLQRAFSNARHALELYAETEKLNLRELGTTLLVAVCHPSWLAVGHIGDGAIVGFWEDGTVTTISEPANEEYANVVRPLTSPDALEAVRYGAWPNSPKAVFLFSDGLQNLALDTVAKAPFESFFRPLAEGIITAEDIVETQKGLEMFLDSDRVNARTDDDKTLVAIGWREVPPEEAPPEEVPPKAVS